MSSRCPECGLSLTLRRAGARFCSTRCRMRAHRRRRSIPDQMRGRRWVRADGKRPITVAGAPASSTDPATWSEHSDVLASEAGDGFGVILGGGLGCFDLDHVTDEQIRAFLESVTEHVVMVERSMSGEGAHVFIEAPEASGWKRTIDGISVERYTRARFIRFTGDRIV